MEAFNVLYGGSGGPSRNSFLDFTPLSGPQKRHVTRIYACLAANMLVTAFGVYIHVNWLSLPSFLCIILSLSCVMALSLTNQKALLEDKILTKERAVYFGCFGLLNGMLIANYLHAVHMFVDPQIVPTAFVASVAAFVCFSASALVAKQRSYLYLGSFLGSMMTYFTIASFLQMFLRFKILNDAMLWMGLLMYLGFVVYDTQLAVVQFDMGNRDYLVHALQFYVNLLSIFIRLVAILSERAADRDRRKRDESED